MTLRTDRLDIVWASPEHLDAALAGDADLAAALGAIVPPSWPPEFIDAPTLEWMRDRLAACDPADRSWWAGFLLLRPAAAAGSAPVLVGTAGYKGPPGEDGTVEIGYSVVTEFQRRRLATEAAGALVRRAFDDPRVRRVIAETLVDGLASQGVLRHCGFVGPEPGSEPGVVRFAVARPGPGQK